MPNPDTPPALQAAFDAERDAHPNAIPVPWYLANIRHECVEGRQRSLSMQERYVREEAGPMALLWRFGQCRTCGLEALSPAPHLVVAADRPPLSGRVAR